MPLDVQQQLQLVATSPQQFTNVTLTPNHPYMASTPATMRFPLGQTTPNTITHNPQHPLTTHPQTPPSLTSQHKHEAAAMFLRLLRRSVQRWAIAAIAVPYDSNRLHALDTQIEGLPGLDALEKTRVRQFIRLFGRRDKKRPRDRLLRDRQTKTVVMDVRKKTAFLGYTWKRMRPLEEVRPTIMPPQRQSGGLFDGTHGEVVTPYGNAGQYDGGGGLPYQYQDGHGWWGGAAHWGNEADGRAHYGKGGFSWR